MKSNWYPSKSFNLDKVISTKELASIEIYENQVVCFFDKHPLRLVIRQNCKSYSENPTFLNFSDAENAVYPFAFSSSRMAYDADENEYLVDIALVANYQHRYRVESPFISTLRLHVDDGKPFTMNHYQIKENILKIKTTNRIIEITMKDNTHNYEKAMRNYYYEARNRAPFAMFKQVEQEMLKEKRDAEVDSVKILVNDRIPVIDLHAGGSRFASFLHFRKMRPDFEDRVDLEFMV